MPKEMVIEKSTTVHKNSTEIFNFLKQTKNQDLFSVWNMKDPDSAKNYLGTDGTIGFVYSWDSKDKSVGAGSQEITNILEGERIDYNLMFLRPMKNTATSSFIIYKNSEDSCLVKWTFTGPTKFPMSLFTSIFRNILGKQMAQSLQNLKVLFEKK